MCWNERFVLCVSSRHIVRPVGQNAHGPRHFQQFVLQWPCCSVIAPARFLLIAASHGAFRKRPYCRLIRRHVCNCHAIAGQGQEDSRARGTSYLVPRHAENALPRTLFLSGKQGLQGSRPRSLPVSYSCSYNIMPIAGPFVKRAAWQKIRGGMLGSNSWLWMAGRCGGVRPAWPGGSPGCEGRRGLHQAGIFRICSTGL